jgi:hypothetical protein
VPRRNMPRGARKREAIRRRDLDEALILLQRAVHAEQRRRRIARQRALVELQRLDTEANPTAHEEYRGE